MIRLIPLLLLLAAAAWLVRLLVRRASQLALRRSRARIVGADRPGSYDWDRRTDQLKRGIKHIGGPSEQRAEILAWLDAHTGVEAYVEPKTVVSPLSVVFVDADGEWRRFELAEDRFLKEVARERRIKVMDATRVGYPPRMRRRRRDDG
ncbi:MAG TPA: hypothetical protein VF351_02130 [Actinomycetota bacterium]